MRRTFELSHQDGGSETFNPAHVISIRIREGAYNVDGARERGPAIIFVTTVAGEKVFKYNVIQTAREEYAIAVAKMDNYIEAKNQGVIR